MKGIHNSTGTPNICEAAVSDTSKVIKMKGIHNNKSKAEQAHFAVSDTSKVIKMKGIHNTGDAYTQHLMLFPIPQR